MVPFLKKKRTKQDILSPGRNYYDTRWNGEEIFCVYRDLEVKTFLPHILWHELDVDEQMMQKTQQLTNVQGQLREKNGQLREKTQQLTNTRRQLQEKDEQLREKTQQLTNVEKQLRERDGQLREKTQQLTMLKGSYEREMDNCLRENRNWKIFWLFNLPEWILNAVEYWHFRR